MDDLYQEIILEHYKNPSNFGKLEQCDCQYQEQNASCGDQFTFYIKLSANNQSSVNRDPRIEAITFTGEGCAISTAACSLLTEYLYGKNISKIASLDINFMKSLVGVDITPARTKCLMLAARGVSQALASLQSTTIKE